jgi:hypothetical protein
MMVYTLMLMPSTNRLLRLKRDLILMRKSNASETVLARQKAPINGRSTPSPRKRR